MSSYADEYVSHLLTWGPNCGAPRSVYQGHLDVLLRSARDAEREACAKIAESEMVDEESTGADSDAAYNLACAHIAAAIRARKEGE